MVMFLVLVSILLASSSCLLAITEATSCHEPFAANSGPSGSNQPRLKLFQLDPVERNHEQDFRFQSGQVIRIKTLAKEPPLFEIPGFLSAEECNHIKQLALEVGLFNSTLMQDREEDEAVEEGSTQELFLDIDTNKDEVLDVHEVLETLDVDVNAFLRPEDALQMFKDVCLDPNKDGVLSLEEFSNIDGEQMNQIKEWTMEHSKDESRLARVSQQTWLSQDDGDDKVLSDLRQRANELTGLPQGIVEHSEKLQVVYYEPGGHFHAHYDSEKLDPDQQCSHTIGLVPEDGSKHDEEPSPRLCRFITILYYLDDTIEGGETAFPVADNETFSEEDLSLDAYDLSRHCHDANLYVKPEKGKAVMWYNHYINDTTGWLGSMNPYSLHGGCDVKQGTKWIANNWITVDDSYDKQMRYMISKESQIQQIPLQDVDDIQDVNNDDFNQVVDNLSDIWTEFLQSVPGKDAVKNAFMEETSLQHVLDVLVHYTLNYASEIQVTHGENDVNEYNIIWLDKIDQTSLNQEVATAELSSLIVMASSYGKYSRHEKGQVFKKAKPHVAKNPNLKADNSEEVNEVPGNIQDSSSEKRTLDEL